MKCIWQQRAWPALKWDAAAIATALSDAVFCQGRFLGKLSEIGFDVQSTVGFETLSAEIVNSAAIEGETLNRDDVRSSVARWMERNGLRLYSLSSQIQKEKASYYEELEHAQRNTLDVTRWVMWFMGLYARAIAASEASLEMILAKVRFWRRHAQSDFNPHQREMLNRLLDGFAGNLTSSKWAKICKVSQDTASREIRALLDCGVLLQKGAGRSTHYCIADETAGSDFHISSILQKGE